MFFSIPALTWPQCYSSDCPFKEDLKKKKKKRLILILLFSLSPLPSLLPSYGLLSLGWRWGEQGGPVTSRDLSAVASETPAQQLAHLRCRDATSMPEIPNLMGCAPSPAQLILNPTLLKDAGP